MNKNMMLLIVAGVAAWYFLIYRKGTTAAAPTTIITEAPKAANPWISTGLTVAGSLFENLLSGGNS